MKLTVSAKSRLFFDRPAVVRAVGKGTASAMGKIGAFVELTARRSIKDSPKRRAAKRAAKRAELAREQGLPVAAARRRRVPLSDRSTPGSPPYNRTGKLRENIRFVFDPGRRALIVGPIGFKGGGVAALEYGGVVQLQFGRGERRRVTIKARPFMRPALAKETTNPKLAQAFRDAIRA